MKLLSSVQPIVRAIYKGSDFALRYLGSHIAGCTARSRLWRPACTPLQSSEHAGDECSDGSL